METQEMAEPAGSPSTGPAPSPRGSTLITGASGLIGRALAAALASSRPVLALSRHRPDLEGVAFVQGDFTDEDDLRRCLPPELCIEALVHLGAVTGGCPESEGMRVNVEGSRRLMRHLLQGGCRRFVLASSIAAVGFADPAFRPLQVPIPDDHPCLARDAYGLSKHLMEEVAGYLARQVEDLDVLCLRLASVADDARLPPPRQVHALRPWALGGITVRALSDAVRLIRLALDAPPRPGLRVRNAAPSRAWVAAPVARFLEGWYGPEVDASAFLRPGHEFDSVFDVGRIGAELGFEASRQPES